MYTISKEHLCTNNKSNIFFTLLYLPVAEISWDQPMNQQVIEGACNEYSWFTQNFEAIFFDTKKKAKAKKPIWACKQPKYVAMYTHKFNLHSHWTKLRTLNLISMFQYVTWNWMVIMDFFNIFLSFLSFFLLVVSPHSPAFGRGIPGPGCWIKISTPRKPGTPPGAGYGIAEDGRGGAGATA